MPRQTLIACCSFVGTYAFGGLDLAATLPPGVAAGATAAVAALGGVAAGRLAKSDDADDRWLNDWTQKTRGAAALWALMDCGIVDALPDRDCPGLSSAELIAAARETSERAPAADAADAVARLLRHLALLKFCDESPTWRFRHSARSRAFVSDDLARSRALSNLSPALVRPWWRVSEALQQNEAPFSLEHGEGAWDYLSRNERDASHFDSLMKGLSEKGGAERSLVALGASDAAFAWSELPQRSRVIDVGGGEGHLLAQILKNHPHFVGTCVDRSDVAARASAYLSNVAGAEAVAGSFFEQLPAGDVYVLKWILHDWDDDDALRILQAVRKSMTADARLVVLERVVGDARATDAHMWVCFGGKERSTAAFEGLLGDAGFVTRSITPLDGDALVAIECETRQ
ncbi:unnamed protein product [Pelagomonas calceolata]|uniref:O-methyltransferase C-terminal domain-containing protein n=1 Tax=Pelagomonas calceolata TaxID=35677 RepID=A0A8J2SDC3_9STRA|nr:unnamed protein product [Pelagomonas calceolata]